MGDHKCEEASKFQQSTGGEYEIVEVPSAGYENRAAIMATKQTSARSPQPTQPSEQGTVDARDDFESLNALPTPRPPMAPLPSTPACMQTDTNGLCH